MKISLFEYKSTEFDFLSTEKRNAHEDLMHLLNDPKFQKQFMVDSLLSSDKKINFLIKNSNISVDEDELMNPINKIILDHHIVIIYIYDTTYNDVKFELLFNSDNLLNSNNELDWESISVRMVGSDNTEIIFKEYKNAPLNIKRLFLKEYVGDIISQIDFNKYIN